MRPKRIPADIWRPSLRGTDDSTRDFDTREPSRTADSISEHHEPPNSQGFNLLSTKFDGFQIRRTGDSHQRFIPTHRTEGQRPDRRPGY